MPVNSTRVEGQHLEPLAFEVSRIDLTARAQHDDNTRTESPTRPKEIEDPARTEKISGNAGTSLNNTEGPVFCECEKVC